MKQAALLGCSDRSVCCQGPSFRRQGSQPVRVNGVQRAGEETGTRGFLGSQQHRNLRGFAQASTAGHSAPIPIPGDNQYGTIFSAVDALGDDASTSGGLGEETMVETSRNGRIPSVNTNLDPSAGGPAAGAPEPPGSGIPHRWRVVGMMALAFVLCNMDKVCMLFNVQHIPRGRHAAQFMTNTVRQHEMNTATVTHPCLVQTCGRQIGDAQALVCVLEPQLHAAYGLNICGAGKCFADAYHLTR